jgi:hypothetical protein
MEGGGIVMNGILINLAKLDQDGLFRDEAAEEEAEIY